ncbi:hypothetical protein U1Q18_012135 [Sarracenia purpurea var. burkii]
MAVGRGARTLLGPLLVVNFVIHLILLGLAAWSLNKYIDGHQNHHHLGGNPATSLVLMFALVSGVTGVCSTVAGLIHHRLWRSESFGIAAPLAIISFSIKALAFG